jgi:hypothetical protein
VIGSNSARYDLRLPGIGGNTFRIAAGSLYCEMWLAADKNGWKKMSASLDGAAQYGLVLPPATPNS